MISVFEKDGATIITIENPTKAEYDFIQRAKKFQMNANVWSKFKCNQNKSSENPAENQEIPFEEVYPDKSCSEIPFEEI